ncbi:MAG: hypothetical protein VKK04_16110 [Synechococcales bacterium]|nr:hypothetical protein [Synechococcales bacterium]
MPIPVLLGVEIGLLSLIQPKVNPAIAHLSLLAFGVTALSFIWWSYGALSHLPLLLAVGLFVVIVGVSLLMGLALLVGLGAALVAADPTASFFESPSIPPYQARFALALLATAGLGAGYWFTSGLQ